MSVAINLGKVRLDNTIIDNLNSYDSKAALSARQGKLLADEINNLKSQGFVLYEHEYDESQNIHNFKGEGDFGFCKCRKTIGVNTDDRYTINNKTLYQVNIPIFSENTWMFFIVERMTDGRLSLLFLNDINTYNYPNGKEAPTSGDLRQNIKIWMACAGLTYTDYPFDENYATDDKLVDHIAHNPFFMSTLFNSANAVNFFKRSTSLIQNFITYPLVQQRLDAAWGIKIPNNNGEEYSLYKCSLRTDIYADPNGAWGREGNAFVATSNANSEVGVVLKTKKPIWPYKIQGIWCLYSSGTAQHSSWKLQGGIKNDAGVTNWEDISDIKPVPLTQATNGWITNNDALALDTMYNTRGRTKAYSLFRLLRTGGKTVSSSERTDTVNSASELIVNCVIYGIEEQNTNG